MNFGNLGFMEILLILVVVLLLFGARRLPEIGASFGKSIKEFKKGISDVDRSIQEETRNAALPPRPAEPLHKEQQRTSRRAPEPKRLICLGLRERGGAGRGRWHAPVVCAPERKRAHMVAPFSCCWRTVSWSVAAAALISLR